MPPGCLQGGGGFNIFLGGRIAHQVIGCTPKGSYGNTAFEKVLGRVLGKGSQKGSEKGARDGFYRKKGFSERVLRRSGQVRPRQGTEICNFGAPSPLEALHWRLSTGFLAFSPVFMCNLVRRTP